MKNQKLITVALLLSLMSFIIEAERKLAPEALELLHSEVMNIRLAPIDTEVDQSGVFCSTKSNQLTSDLVRL